ncbi:yigP [Pseudoalteromonas citrea]|uniref:Ubiquinone biosynthesis accessory factor UbiJ n=2 Tax=Pseudoalteromonas citrea TaxID=43655 RepID=A0AAD4AG81_9GAMM|nr:SCP2 sterol-binding domain-containing protein [Pseudoalteromonas citrea]KAF7767680.1 yigP [Pseudoalteromonas citrea]
MIEVIACAALEATLNRLLTLEPQLTVALENTKHKVLCVELRDWQQNIALTYTGKQFMLFSQYDDAADCKISANIDTLMQLTNPSLLTQLIRQDKLDLEGDLQLAQSYSNAFSNLDINWAEHLSRYLGDAPAQHVVNCFQDAKEHGASANKTLQNTLTQLCQDELRVTIHPLELEQFKVHVRHIKNHTAQLEQRINSLLNR